MFQEVVFYLTISAIIIAVTSVLMYSFIRVPSMVLGDDFMNMFSVQRTLYVAGRKGGGKTLLSFFVSALAYAKGEVKTIHANVPSVITNRVSIPLQDAVFIVDECQDFISDAGSAKEAEAFIRKLRLRFIMAGVGAPHRSFTKLKCWRVFNGYKIFVPFWVYRWRWEGVDEVEKGTFILLRPDLVYFFYDTQEIPPDDGGLFDALSKTVQMHKLIAQDRIEEDMINHAGRNNGKATGDTETAESDDPVQDSEGVRGVTDAEKIGEAFADLAEGFEDSATKIQRAAESLKKATRKRR